MDGQLAAAAIFDKAQISEFLHEVTDPRPRGADHLGQVILTDSRNLDFSSAVLASPSQHQENPSQTLLTRVEKLVNQVLFVSDVARQEMCDEQSINVLPFLEHTRHSRFLHFGQAAIGHGDRR